ncbi:hypothetical protein T459_02924 [Capsicum annuum]|uniref:Uncharacterized protein n=1 Tax=Capsicum annuum TaxID=4072 RepID=A0A2G3ALE0_CAPAN|nr:hypothetical protein T459_02924 [Capsicum annuum]
MCWGLVWEIVLLGLRPKHRSNGGGHCCGPLSDHSYLQHQSGIRSEGFRSLAEGKIAEYEVENSSDGRTKAVDVSGPDGAAISGGSYSGNGGARGVSLQWLPFNDGRGNGSFYFALSAEVLVPEVEFAKPLELYLAFKTLVQREKSDVFLDNGGIVCNSPVGHKTGLGVANYIRNVRLQPVGNELRDDFVVGVTKSNMSEVLEVCSIPTL